MKDDCRKRESIDEKRISEGSARKVSTIINSHPELHHHYTLLRQRVVRRRSSRSMNGTAPEVVLHAAKNCPFGQRVQIALVLNGHPFELVSCESDSTAPVLEINGVQVVDSQVCMEFIDDAFGRVGVRVLPIDPLERAQHRMMSEHVTKSIVPAFYRMLLKSDKQSIIENAQKMLGTLDELTQQMHPTGPFFGGDELQYFDIMLAPFALRFGPVLKHFRGFQVPSTMERYHRWFFAIRTHPAIAATLSDDVILTQHYSKYANGMNVKDVANLIRMIM